MKKFHDFTIIQILREINFGDLRSAKIATFATLGALNIVHKNLNSESLNV